MTAPTVRDQATRDQLRAQAADIYGRMMAVGPTGPDAIDVLAGSLAVLVREGQADLLHQLRMLTAERDELDRQLAAALRAPRPGALS